LLPLLKVGQEEFYTKHDKVTINLSGGGFFHRSKASSSRFVDIGNSDVALGPDLKDKGLVETNCGWDTIRVIANKDVPVDNLSAQQYVTFLLVKSKTGKKLAARINQLPWCTEQNLPVPAQRLRM
jgi:phosphate transport system substrate-binding protein